MSVLEHGVPFCAPRANDLTTVSSLSRTTLTATSDTSRDMQ